MTYLADFVTNKILWIGFAGWFSAQLLKVIITLIIQKRLDFSRFFGSGGMPSSHSSFFCAVSTAVGFQEGFESAVFALSVCFTFIIMYDAAGVRRAAGHHAQVLNKILDDMLHKGEGLSEARLKELIGHTPVQVLAGALLGIIIGVLLG